MAENDAVLEALPAGLDDDEAALAASDELLAPGQSAWGEAEARAAELVRMATGKSLPDHLMALLCARPGMQMLALGVGAGGLGLDLLSHAPDAALVCIDSNAEWLQPSRQRARELGHDARFEALDLDTVELEPRAFDVIFCHAVLFRVVELERMVDQVRRALRPNGTLVVVDVVTRNGHAMWGETREVAHAIWKTLPIKFRLNHTAYTVPLIDDVIWEPKPVPSGAKIPRPEDILPVIEQRFVPLHFVPHFSLSRRFFDSMYGPNYDLGLPLDRALFNWIWQLDVHYVTTKRLHPETFFGIYQAR